jgi:hypothetical protein
MLGPLLWPESQALSNQDRQTAHAKIESAASQGALTVQEAEDRHELLRAANTRGELRRVFNGLPAAVPPSGLTRALRLVTAAWLAICVVQFLVWVILAVFGHFDGPWWLWSDIGAGLVVAGLWWLNETYHRSSQLDPKAIR